MVKELNKKRSSTVCFIKLKTFISCHLLADGFRSRKAYDITKTVVFNKFGYLGDSIWANQLDLTLLGSVAPRCNCWRHNPCHFNGAPHLCKQFSSCKILAMSLRPRSSLVAMPSKTITLFCCTLLREYHRADVLVSLGISAHVLWQMLRCSQLLPPSARRRCWCRAAFSQAFERIFPLNP